MEPNLNCPNCFKFYREHKKEPKCFANKCDIQEIAPNIQYARILEDYLSFKRLSMVNGAQGVAQKILRDSGLEDEPDLLIRLENVFDKFMGIKQKQKAALKRK